MPTSTCYNCLSGEDDMGYETSASISNNNNSPEEPCLEEENSSSDELVFGMTTEDNRTLREIKRRASRLSQRRGHFRHSAHYPDLIKGTSKKKSREAEEAEDSDQPSEEESDDESGSESEDPRDEKRKLLSYVERNIIGNDTMFVGPYGLKTGKIILRVNHG